MQHLAFCIAVAAVALTPRTLPVRMCSTSSSSSSSDAQRAALLERARQRHADTERALAPPPPPLPPTPPTTTNAKVLGERPWAGPSTRQDISDLPFEPLACAR
jgi:hypothetical protein